MFLGPLFQIGSLGHIVAFGCRIGLIRKNHNCFTCVVMIEFLIGIYDGIMVVLIQDFPCFSLIRDYKVNR